MAGDHYHPNANMKTQEEGNRGLDSGLRVRGTGTLESRWRTGPPESTTAQGKEERSIGQCLEVA